MESVTAIFGSMVFNESVMAQRLPKDAFKAVKRTMSAQGEGLTLDVANVVANAMKDWAVEKGATHFTHWFQPMTGITAEKHDSFITPAGDGNVIMEFSGKALVKGESDASSFPSGGLRCTFEARGYTVWDATSYAFIKDKTLYIPTAFCSYGGQALDKKTPLLRSMQTLNEQALRIIRLFGNHQATSVVPMAGPEQEYFLVDKDVYLRRPDLISCGRTLFGAKPPKGQELNDHYYGSIKSRISAFMRDLDIELWKMGVYAKTKHNEAAPSQHELAIVYTTTNMACDHNQITMDLMKSLAGKHGLVCLLHEKPFAGVNGSGKHNNWSLATDKGENLLKPGKTPHENAQFLLFLVAVIAAVDKYQDLIRVSAASAGNDHRLGGHEAPPAIVSMYLGDELTDILEAIEKGTDYENVARQPVQIGVTALPDFPQDSTDRNRTSPFAFTGNKFEFRMSGSSFSLSGFNIVLNTAVAEILQGFADELENTENFQKQLHELIKRVYTQHKRVIFSGNNYSQDWVEEAAQRGLSNLDNAVCAYEQYVTPQNTELFAKHNIFTAEELQSRYEILLEIYSKTIMIEAHTMLEMVRKSIAPACLSYQEKLANVLLQKRQLGMNLDCTLETQLLKQIASGCTNLLEKTNILKSNLYTAEQAKDLLTQAQQFQHNVVSSMDALRHTVDDLEVICAKDYWPMPTYSELLYSIN
ncbi:MAG: glutamine synthetase III [Defluviitaleaceae bacterium]|nr:glutamine synthetase III [Defluviitaleaceae bacterium]